MILDKELLASAKSGPRRKGRKELIAYLEGGKISRSQAVKAHCYSCLGMGDSGDCDLTHCALYPYSPYKTMVSRKSDNTDTEEGGNVAEPTGLKGENDKESIIEEVSHV